MTADSIPRFNHVAMSVPPELLSGDTAQDLLRFYDEVFGWGPMPTMVKEGELIARGTMNELRRGSETSDDLEEIFLRLTEDDAA